MSDALAWVRKHVCGHEHDTAEEELDCLLEILHRLRSGEDPLAILNEPP